MESARSKKARSAKKRGAKKGNFDFSCLQMLAYQST